MRYKALGNSLYKEDAEWKPREDGLPVFTISRKGWLERELDRGDFFYAIKGMKGNKALGPDGFTLFSFKNAGIFWRKVF